MASTGQTPATWDINKISAIGPGLISAQTAVPAHFTIYFKGYKPNPLGDSEDSDDPRVNLDYQLEGPSEPGPLTCYSNKDDGSVDVSYSPLLPGRYQLCITLHGQHIPGSPFPIPVTGESIKAHTMTCKVRAYFDCEKKGVIKVGKINRVKIDVGNKKIGGGLSVAMAGPKGATVGLKMDESQTPIYAVTYSPSVPGGYLLYVKMAGCNIPGSPFSLKAVPSV
jgi:hypothetical protein